MEPANECSNCDEDTTRYSVRISGSINGDVSSRRGRIEKLDMRPGSGVITAFVPLSEMFGYSTILRSMTQGRATYTMHFHRYEEAPKSVREEVIAKVQGTAK